MEIIFFGQEIRTFVDRLQASERAKVDKTLLLLEISGHRLRMPHSKKITNRLFELRTLGTITVRIFYVFKHTRAYLIHGFIKKSEHIPERELRHALDMLTILDNKSV